VDGVAADSPAQEAGLQENDLILEFGSANHLNHRDLKGVLEIVPTAAANHEEVAITLLRREQPSVDPDVPHSAETAVRKRMIVKIRPRPWAGRGLLGCHIKAYDDTLLEGPAE
jgi:26S proteasome non-ATPase regulatory subunit 9